MLKESNNYEIKENDKKFKIAMIGHKRIPSREGGVEVVVNELATRLVKQGYSVTAYNRVGDHVSGKKFNKIKDNKYKQYNGINIVNTPTINLKGVAAFTSSITATLLAVIKSKFSKNKYDCIHFHAEGPSAMAWLPAMLGIRVVVTIHGLDWQRAKWGVLGKKYIKFGEKIAVKYADEIIVLSKNIQEYFKEKYNRDTVFISNGVNLANNLNSNLIKEKWNLEKDEYILYLGRLVPEKGLHYLIKAYKRIKTNKKLVIAGGVSGTEEYARMVMNMAKDNENIIFVDFVEGTELQELYSNAYIYCLPSDLEGMPLSLLEAMSYGNCCIISDIPECAEVIEDKGIIFKKSDIDDLAKVLQQCCEDVKLVKNYKEKAAKFITQKYSWSEVVNKTVKLYRGEKV